MFVSKKIKFLFFICSTLVFCCGCANSTSVHTSSNSIPSDHTSPEGSPVSEADSIQLTPLQAFGGEPWGGFAEDGFYYVDPAVRPDGSTRINYIDYKTQRAVPLCAQPNCTHDTVSCAGFIPLCPGGVCPMVANQTLVLFYQGNAREGPGREVEAVPRVEVMELDGSGRREICRFAANQIPERPVLTDGNSLYLRVTTYNETKTTAQLICIDLDDGECKALYDLDTGRNERIWGGQGHFIYLYRYSASVESAFEIAENTCYELCRMDLLTGEKTSLFQWDTHNMRPWLDGNILVWLNTSDGFYHQRDLANNKEVIFKQYTPNETGSAIIDADAEHIIIRETKPSETEGAGYERSFYTLWKDGRIAPWNLVYDYEGDLEPIQRICAANGTRYLVMLDERFEQTSLLQTDGTSAYVLAPTAVYGLMDQENYWNGTNSWDEIANR